MRSTRAASAIERLKVRSGNRQYSMVRTAEGLFYLTLNNATEPAEKLSDLLELDPFVKFINAFGPQQPRRMSKLDVAFEKQLVKKTP